eukprot:TRINITY_DN4647_c0_g1_i1.p1 TRINITY_DN4647_c0_g1~~TRINITY_DN4647_c0_g1_i1.p1  ORF type:complete len:1476 (+),score=335.61 TRINITY_DN4647_c0_g1_i1:68-4495(+)
MNGYFKLKLIFILLILISNILCEQYYIDSENGDDINDGTILKPFKTLYKGSTSCVEEKDSICEIFILNDKYDLKDYESEKFSFVNQTTIKCYNGDLSCKILMSSTNRIYLDGRNKSNLITWQGLHFVGVLSGNGGYYSSYLGFRNGSLTFNGCIFNETYIALRFEEYTILNNCTFQEYSAIRVYEGQSFVVKDSYFNVEHKTLFELLCSTVTFSNSTFDGDFLLESNVGELNFHNVTSFLVKSIAFKVNSFDSDDVDSVVKVTFKYCNFSLAKEGFNTFYEKEPMILSDFQGNLSISIHNSVLKAYSEYSTLFKIGVTQTLFVVNNSVVQGSQLIRVGSRYSNDVVFVLLMNETDLYFSYNTKRSGDLIYSDSFLTFDDSINGEIDGVLYLVGCLMNRMDSAPPNEDAEIMFLISLSKLQLNFTLIECVFLTSPQFLIVDTSEHLTYKNITIMNSYLNKNPYSTIFSFHKAIMSYQLYDMSYRDDSTGVVDKYRNFNSLVTPFECRLDCLLVYWASDIKNIHFKMKALGAFRNIDFEFHKLKLQVLDIFTLYKCHLKVDTAIYFAVQAERTSFIDSTLEIVNSKVEVSTYGPSSFGQFQMSRSSLLITQNSKFEAEFPLFAKEFKMKDDSYLKIIDVEGNEKVSVFTFTTLNITNSTINVVGSEHFKSIIEVTEDFEMSDQSLIYLANSKFKNSFMEVGGNVKITGLSSVNVDHVTSENACCWLYKYQSTEYSIFDSSKFYFRSCKAKNGVMRLYGDLYLKTIENDARIKMDSNHANKSGGGFKVYGNIIFSDIIHPITIIGNDNKADTFAGCISIYQFMFIDVPYIENIINIEFDSNTAAIGGALTIRNTTNLNFIDNFSIKLKITNCKATLCGGGLFIDSVLTEPIQSNQVVFEGNQAPSGDDLIGLPWKIKMVGESHARPSDVLYNVKVNFLDYNGHSFPYPKYVIFEGLADVFEGKLLARTKQGVLINEVLQPQVTSLYANDHLVFPGFALEASPDISVVLSVEIPSGLEKLTEKHNLIWDNLTINMEQCAPGYFDYNISTVQHKCLPCASGSTRLSDYEFDSTSTCQRCATPLLCLTEQISVPEGLYPFFTETEVIPGSCSRHGVCYGGLVSKQHDIDNICDSLYTGALCSYCHQEILDVVKLPFGGCRECKDYESLQIATLVVLLLLLYICHQYHPFALEDPVWLISIMFFQLSIRFFTTVTKSETVLAIVPFIKDILSPVSLLACLTSSFYKEMVFDTIFVVVMVFFSCLHLIAFIYDRAVEKNDHLLHYIFIFCLPTITTYLFGVSFTIFIDGVPKQFVDPNEDMDSFSYLFVGFILVIVLGYVFVLYRRHKKLLILSEIPSRSRKMIFFVLIIPRVILVLLTEMQFDNFLLFSIFRLIWIVIAFVSDTKNIFNDIWLNKLIRKHFIILSTLLACDSFLPYMNSAIAAVFEVFMLIVVIFQAGFCVYSIIFAKANLEQHDTFEAMDL